jgi:2-polyprenyl-6-methoxyphenol hydroxylase-like FAD-dependent oxidoreductase
VVGADGKHSAVARAARAAQYRTEAARSLACYTYWEGVEMDGGEMYGLGRRSVGAWPTNDGLVMTYVAWPGEEFETFRGDVEGNVLATLDLAGTLGERVRSGRRAERFRATPDLPNIIRVPYGDRWALVGDAGLVMDPITGQGIGHALRDAELLSRALGDARRAAPVPRRAGRPPDPAGRGRCRCSTHPAARVVRAAQAGGADAVLGPGPQA